MPICLTCCLLVEETNFEGIQEQGSFVKTDLMERFVLWSGWCKNYPYYQMGWRVRKFFSLKAIFNYLLVSYFPCILRGGSLFLLSKHFNYRNRFPSYEIRLFVPYLLKASIPNKVIRHKVYRNIFHLFCFLSFLYEYL